MKHQRTPIMLLKGASFTILLKFRNFAEMKNLFTFYHLLLVFVLTYSSGHAYGGDLASMRAILEGRFRNGKPIRLVDDITTVSDMRDPAKSPRLRTLRCYEVNPLDLNTWRYDRLYVGPTGRGGGDLVSAISKNGAIVVWTTSLSDEEDVDKLSSSNLEPMNAPKKIQVSMGDGVQISNPDPNNRVYGLTLGSMTVERYFSKFPQNILEVKKISRNGHEFDALVLKKPPPNESNYAIEFDVKTGMLLSYRSSDSTIIQESYGKGLRLGNEILFGVPEKIVSVWQMGGGDLMRSEIIVNQEQCRILSQEEFEARLNPELPVGAFVRNNESSQTTRITQEDLPVRIWECNNLFTPERKAKGLIEYLKKAQE